MWKVVILCELAAAFVLLFIWIRRESIIYHLISKAYESLEEASAKRTAESRRIKDIHNGAKGKLYRLEQRLLYSGIHRKIPSLSPEIYIVFNLLFAVLAYFGGSILTGNWGCGLVAVVVLELSLHLLINYFMMRNYNATDEGLLKFLDFLGNYSLTSGEITSVLGQVGVYLEDPLKSVLEECCYEAQITGDAGEALLSMIEKIQHPKFKELVRNLEISMRYSADFTVLVSQSRRSIREYMRMRQERKALASEAWVSIVILGAMTVVILMALEALIGIPIEDIVWSTWLGKICMGGIGIILLLFYSQIRSMDK